MATGSGSRDVTLTLTVDTLGEDGIKQLQTAINALAAEGGAAGPEFQKLAEQVARLGEQNAALQAVKTLADETAQLTQAQDSAAQRAQALADKLDVLKQAAAAAGQKQQEAATAVSEAKKAQIDLAAEISKLNKEYDAASKKTDEYKTKFNELVDKQAEGKKKIVELRDEQKAANTEYNAAQSQVSSLTREYDRASAAVEKAAKATNDSKTAFDGAVEQASKLGVATTDLATAEGSLIAIFNRGVTAVNEHSAVVAKAEAAIKEMVAAAEVSSAKIQDAFKTVGVRSAQELKDEIAKTKAAMETLAAESSATGTTLKGAFDAGNEKVKNLERDLRELNGTMTLGDKTAKLFSGALGQIAAGNLVADAVGYLVQKVKDLSVEFFTVNLEAQRLSKALGQVYGDSGLAAKQFAFLRETADKSGLSIRDLSDGFIRFSAAANSSGISLQNANALFVAVSKAAGQLGLSGANVTGTLEALGQMASKGVVSMEELRQQLGDRLPGALSIAAKGMGVTQDELVKMVESGSLATKVFFPAFEKGLNETFTSGEKKVEGFIQGWNRLVNAIVKTAQAASDTSAFTKLGQAFDFVADRIGFVVKAVELLVARFAILKVVELASSFLGLGNSAAKAAVDITAKAAAVEKDTVATNANTTALAANTAATGLSTAAKAQNAAAWTAVGTAIASSTPAIVGGAGSLQKVGAAADSATKSKGLLVGAMGLLGSASSKLVGLLGGPAGALLTLALYGKEAGTAIGETAAKMFGWGKVLEDNEKKIAALAEAERKAAEKRRIATNEQDIASTKAAANAAQAVKLAEKMVEAVDAEVKVVRQKFNATQDLVRLQGDDIASTKALAVVSQEMVEVAKIDLASKEALATAARNQIEAIKGVTDANKKLTPTQEQQIKTLEEIAKKRQEEANEQSETIRQLTVEAASRKLASDALKDNSGRVNELGQAYEDAKTKLEVMSKSGVMSLAQIQKAEIDVASAAGLYRDAIKDVIRNTEVELKQATALVAVKDSQSAVRIKHLEVLKAEAQQQGRVNDVVKLDNEIVSENIKILERKKVLIEQEIQAGLTIIDAKRKELTANTDENIAKRKLLDVEEQLLISRRDSLKSIDEQIKGLKNSKAAVDSLAEAFHQLGIKTPEELQQIADKNAAAWEKISQDGRVGTEQLKSAFEKYAQSVVDAAGDIGKETAKSMLEAQGATRGLTVAIDETGKVTVDAMSKGAKAIDNARGYMDGFQRSALAATAALESQNAQRERSISALEKEVELKEREAELERKKQGVDKDGFRVDANGNRIMVNVPTRAGVFEQAKSRGLNEEQALSISKKFVDDSGNATGWGSNKPWSVALNEAIEKLILENAANSISKNSGEILAISAAKQTGTGTADRPTVVNINLNGKQRQVKTDPAGAAAIQDLLGEIEKSSKAAV